VSIVDADVGEVLSRVQVTGTLTGPLAVRAGTVHFGTTDGVVYRAVDAETAAKYPRETL
jgi:hypothetical protein